MKEGIAEASSLTGVDGRIIGLPGTPQLRFPSDSHQHSNIILQRYCNMMIERGYIVSSNHHWFLCASMTEAIIDDFIEESVAVFRLL
jgi:glutamate-1-semialdehyde aminotransferase